MNMPTIDPAVVSAAFSGRKGVSVAGGFLLAVATAASAPERWAAIMAALQGVEWYLACAILGISVVASARHAQEPEAGGEGAT